MKTIVLMLAGVALSHAEPVAALGKAGEFELSAAELRETIASLDGAQAAAVTKDAAALGQFARALLLQRAVVRQATEKQWDQEPAVVASLVRARETALAESYLSHISAPPPDFPTEAELRTAYDQNRAALRVPRSYQLAQIFIADDRPMDKPAPERMTALQRQLKGGKGDFAALAKASSEDKASAANGGAIGWLTEAQIQPEIRAQLPKLTLGMVTGPLRLADGWHILKVLDIREAHTPILDQVRGQLAAKLRAERAGANRQRFLADLLREQEPVIDEAQLTRFLRESGQPSTPR